MPQTAYIPDPELRPAARPTSFGTEPAKAVLDTDKEEGPPTPPPPGAATTYKRKERRYAGSPSRWECLLSFTGLASSGLFLKALELDASEGRDAGPVLPLVLLCVLLAHLTGLMADGIRLARSLGGDLTVAFLPKGDVDSALTTTTEGKERLPKKMWVGADTWRHGGATKR